jgi:hypothetical protein
VANNDPGAHEILIKTEVYDLSAQQVGGMVFHFLFVVQKGIERQTAAEFLLPWVNGISHSSPSLSRILYLSPLDFKHFFAPIANPNVKISARGGSKEIKMPN